MNYDEKVNIILKNNFRMFGLGHFDLEKEDIKEILVLLDKPNADEKIKELYERLEKQRMG